MSVDVGTRLGSLEITALLGKGGMGEVYRARDTQLKRDVAIKILPDEFSRDANRVRRFQREAEVLASLNHPNIAAIYNVQEANGSRFLVLELIEGETLADRIARGSIPVEEALDIAKYICEALEAAHEKGIVHRDLKPANVKITPEGKVKVLDFGLAKATESVPANVNLSSSPTLSLMATNAGMILGTAAYMSPEQARGKTVDKRADIWAFGCVLYEMLAGKRAFHGEDATEILASVFKTEPDWRALPADTPSNIRTLLFRCLQKDIKKRTRDAGDIVIELEEALSPSATLAAPIVAPILSRRSLLVGVSGLLLGSFIVGVGVAVWRLGPAPMAPVRFTVTLPPGQRLAVDRKAIAFSPDGRHLAYVASAGGPYQLYLREVDSLEGKPIAGTEGAGGPFFSPDGQWLAFFTLEALKKVSISGGPPVALASLEDGGRGGTWGSDGNIVFTYGSNSGLFVVNASGGAAVHSLTTLDRQKSDSSHRFPYHLPGGRALLFTVGTGGNWDDARIELLKIGSGERKVLISGGSDARYVPTGHLLYRRAGTLMAVPFDLGRLDVTGSPVVLVEGVRDNDTGAALAVFSDAGSLLYVSGSARAFENTLTWVDRKGAEQPLGLPPRTYFHPRLSPEGERVVLHIDQGNSSDVMVYNLLRGTLARLTVGGQNFFPVWTPDGNKVTFSSNKPGGRTNLFWKTADGSRAEERLTTSENNQLTGAWSPDGQTLAFTESNPTTTGLDIWTLSLKNKRTPQPVLRTPFRESSLAFSPDGRWVAYQSNESGRDEVYVQRFPEGDNKVLISYEGGTEPVWSHDGHELFYRSGEKMLAVATMIQDTFRASKPEVLFERPYLSLPPVRNYDVTSDGRRFLMIKASEQAAAAAQINVVLNWFSELQQRVPVK